MQVNQRISHSLSENKSNIHSSQDALDISFCPCCEQTCSSWLDYSPYYRGVVCPNCSSQPRHRALKLYLKKSTNLYKKPLKFLHFAPEKIFREEFSKATSLNYITADLNDPSVDFKIDIMSIPCPENNFDVIFCSHVLEHVSDDRKAMSELFRILKPGGWSFLQVPIDPNRNKTFEDDTIVSPEDRLRHFWQEDHVRLYGLDYKDRLQKCGFLVKIEKISQIFSPAEIKLYGLDIWEDLYFGYKPV